MMLTTSILDQLVRLLQILAVSHSLLYLDLSFNQLSGAIPGGLRNLSVLQYLYLNSNQLSGAIPASLASLTSIHLNLYYNGLFAVDPHATAWANARNPYWASAQTVPPANVVVPSVTSSSATLSWRPIAYTERTGRYEVWAAAGGSAFLAGWTADKSATGLIVTGLIAGTTYTFTVRTVTYSNVSNLNTVTSNFSAGVVATTSLCTAAPDNGVAMLQGRFRVAVAFRNQFDGGRVGQLAGRSLSASAVAETLLFSFGDPLVVELLVRLSDARPFANRIDVYYGGGSDVELTITLFDTMTGICRTYLKPANQPLGGVDRGSFPASSASTGETSAGALRAAPARPLLNSTLRLLNNRYEVRMRYRNQFANPPATGYLVGQSIASSATTESAIFTFSDPEVAEWMVRFSDARPFANRIDFFHGGGSDIELTIEVRDTMTGQYREYSKPAFSFLGAVDRTSWTP